MQELREFCCENADSLNDILTDINKANGRIDDAEKCNEELEECIQKIEEATMVLLELQKRFEDRLTDKERRSRRANIRIHGLKEGAEDNAPSMNGFVETLPRENLELALSFELWIKSTPWAQASQPPGDSPPRSILVKLLCYRIEEELIKVAWQKKRFHV